MIDLGYAGAVLGGILSLLSPCSVMLLPAFFAFAFDDARTTLVRVGLFGVGLLATLMPLGVAAGSLGAALQQHRSLLVWVAAVVVILLGVAQIVGIPLPGIARTGTTSSSPLGVLLLGTVYGVAGVCAGPVLGTVLTVAAARGEPLYGGLLLAAYAGGMLVPLLVLALAWRRFGGRIRAALRPREIAIGRWRNSVTVVVSGIVSIVIGIVLLVTDGTSSLGGLLGATDQAALEHEALRAASGIGDTVAIVAAALVALALLAWRWFRGRARDAAVAPPEHGETGPR